MATERHGTDVFDRNTGGFGEEAGEASAIEHAGHADNSLRRQARELLKCPNHDVERIGDADDEGVRRVLSDGSANLFHDLEVDTEQIIAAHAGLARHASGDDADVGAIDS